MKRKRIIITASVILLAIFGTKSLLWAQKPYKEKVQHKTERMAKKLDLSEEQKEKVYAINLKKVEARKTIKNSKEAYSKEDRKKQFKIRMEEWKEELKTVLSEEQLKKLKIE